MSEATRHCYNCGWEYKLQCSPARTETCHQCGADLRVCLNCVSYDPKYAYQCKDKRADPVDDKKSANFCEYFEFAKRIYVPNKEINKREESAREQLRKLLGD